ncbi:Gfo/Idh/MocA family protein [Sphingosinicella xenopeptidilytica]|uniref:Gfo/Idh/MocA family protein n=1 Tax=Sphingosinicella xenopeptidilytica TaxID=364098 RepID=A0ABW3C676_SPHXN
MSVMAESPSSPDHRSADKILRIGIVGLGQASGLVLNWERQDIRTLPIRFTAAADLRQEALAQFAKEYDAEVYSDVEALCRSPNVDAVYISSPHELHREHTIIAARNGKHVLCEKPLSLSAAEVDEMIAACDQHGVHLIAAHSHAMDAPIRAMREVIASGRLGPVRHINAINYNFFNAQPWPTRELQMWHGDLYNQGPHQMDIIRYLGGGMVKSVRAQTWWDHLRNVEGGYSAFIEFENGAVSTAVFDWRGYFDSTCYTWNASEGGWAQDPGSSGYVRDNMKRLLAEKSADAAEAELWKLKNDLRYGGVSDNEAFQRWGYAPVTPGFKPFDEPVQPFFGLIIVACDRGIIRQSLEGLYIHGDHGVEEVPVTGHSGRAAEFMQVYDAVFNDKPSFHDGRWGKGTVELCQAIEQSAAERRTIELKHQVPVGDEPA